MKKFVLTFGLIAGAILSAMLIVTFALEDRIDFDKGEVIGYTSMVLAFLLIYFGVRSYRDNVAGGRVRFGRAFAVGALIALVGSVCYVITWQVIYYNFAPDFVSEYQAHVLEDARAEGASVQEIAELQTKMDRFAELYDNPAFNVAVTFLEPLPVALVMTLVSAGILSRRGRSRDPDESVGPVRAET